MTLSTFSYVCANGHPFEAPDSSGEYGEFVVRGEISAEPGVLPALDDPVYLEVDDLLRQMGAYRGRSEVEQADLLQEVFGVACDAAPDGTRIRIGRKAPCPVCGTREMASWEPTGPYPGSTFDVTHRQWQHLTAREKKTLLEEAVNG
jgi:hypothetical protein